MKLLSSPFTWYMLAGRVVEGIFRTFWNWKVDLTLRQDPLSSGPPRTRKNVECSFKITFPLYIAMHLQIVAFFFYCICINLESIQNTRKPDLTVSPPDCQGLLSIQVFNKRVKTRTFIFYYIFLCMIPKTKFRVWTFSFHLMQLITDLSIYSYAFFILYWNKELNNKTCDTSSPIFILIDLSTSSRTLNLTIM